MDDEAEGYYWREFTYFEQGDFEKCSSEHISDFSTWPFS